jgi:diguanylate cyclase (GGDEF)-like protein
LKLVDEHHTEYIAAVGYELSNLQRVRLTIEETFLYVKTNGVMDHPIIIPDIRKFNASNISSPKFDTFEEIHAFSVNTTLNIPIFINKKLYGMINIDSEETDAFQDEIIPLANYMSNQISSAIDHFLQYKDAEQLSKYDSLTSAYTRSYFESIFSNFVSKALRYDESFILALLDFDNLKIINDQYGHLAGDYALKQLSSNIAEDIRDSDLFVRYGGDEFIIIFFESTFDEVNSKMKAIQSKISRNNYFYHGNAINISFSFGISSFPEDSIAYELLIKTSDLRMYKNKASKSED